MPKSNVVKYIVEFDALEELSDDFVKRIIYEFFRSKVISISRERANTGLQADVAKASANYLDSGMSNILAWRLGEIASEAGDPKLKGVGDHIDRGLILRRLLEEKGFFLVSPRS